MAAFDDDDKDDEPDARSGRPGRESPADVAASAMIPPREQAVVASLVFAALAAMTLAFWQAGGCRGLADHDAPPRRDTRFRIDLNAASRVELMQLPGIGPTMADRIVEFREANGPFPTVDGLSGVPGIGEATLERIRPYLRVPNHDGRDVRAREPLPAGR